ncbi:toll/interleukin-1 receptor domain-containing protein [Flavobacterium sp. F-328]|uniref:Toll/interleukin-1 receptor domain-containing protein n=1 Tax=Flavobacterium erciyesense TaxID=2825842 RepID=A0ABS5D1P9_9FLAO|nr:toll/interleukin-1 receptor domain-containing protein [Flavobacterium erciyesense]MBQ0907932.1 toll/interleukin-1 receptor domain-containing protein [Flavobacterium erciyesense]
MRIFISWSGDLSKNIAEIFRQWIPGVIQAAKPYYSPDDITKGTRWSSEISKELDASKIGIICLTKDNLDSNWIMFEAGALSKNIEKSKVVPLLFGIEPSDIQGPLVQFQAARFSKSEMKKVVKMVNSELGETALAPDVIDSVFEMWWPKLESQIKEAEEKAKSVDNKDLRSERDLIEEVLSLTRELSINRRFERERSFHPRAFEDMISSVERLTEAVYENGNFELIEYIRDLHRPLEYFVEEAMNSSPGVRKELYSRYRRSKMLMEELISIPEKRVASRVRKTKPDSDEIK